MSMSKSDAIASAVLGEFERLAANRKPAVRTNGVREWVPLSGIVAELSDGKLKCLALATGMKCLPMAKVLLANGIGIHDWHAEILALRAFNRFILQECYNVLTEKEPSEFISASWETGNSLSEDRQPFAWRDAVQLHMYCSEAPCGDASMELTMATQDDASPWPVPTATTEVPEAEVSKESSSEPMLSGRGYFSQLGMVRRKPGRGDSPQTLSKSCSDKLALRQCTSLLSGLSSLLVAPSPGLYLRSIVLPASQHSESGCQRCFSAQDPSGRMQPVAGLFWPGGYVFTPFDIQTTDLEFAYSKKSVARLAQATSLSPVSSNLSAVWTCHGVNECLVGGVLRGRKAFDLAGASSVSRRHMWQLVDTIAKTFTSHESQESTDQAIISQRARWHRQVFHGATYDDVKASELLASRCHVKRHVKDAALRGWAPNNGDGNWKLDT